MKTGVASTCVEFACGVHVGIIIQMKLPNCERAIVSVEKLTDYLLSLTHSVGGSKARYFRAIGFNDGNVGSFEQAPIKIAQTNEIVDEKTSAYDVNYVIDGMLETPGGEKIYLRTVWIIETDQAAPRFVTAYPA